MKKFVGDLLDNKDVHRHLIFMDCNVCLCKS